MSRSRRRETAEETIEVLTSGCYANGLGETVRIVDSLERMDCLSEGPAAGAFENVRFSVLDHAEGEPTFTAFKNQLAK